MTYRELWQKLAPMYGEREAQAVARLVMEDRFGLSMTDICVGKDSELSDNEHREMQKMVQRILAEEPVQYVVGSAVFCGNRFSVNGDVLIPRPETAFLVDFVVRECAETKHGLNVLDICTGSGCIAISIAKALPSARVAAWDISEKALNVARGNAKLHDVDVDFAMRDALRLSAEEPRWDFIVSNPPYVLQREESGMERNVLDYEPHLALFVDDGDPLAFHRSIARYAQSTLRKGGKIAMEINPLLSTETADVLRECGFGDVAIVEDEFGRNRFVAGRR